MRASGASLRRAVVASVVLHVACAVLLVVVVRSRATRVEPSAPPVLDTRVPELRMRLVPDEPETVVVAPAPESRGADPPPPVPQEPATSRLPLARMPETFPPEVLALLRKPAPAAPAPPVVEVPVTPTPLHPMPEMIQPAAGVAQPNMLRPAVGASGGAEAGPPAPPIHGALRPGQTIVYVLDASGSMGEYGKFDRARRALIATLKKQPETVRFQVVVYAAIAIQPLPAPANGCVAATAENVERMERALQTIQAAGRSNHVEGVKAAVELRPDVVLILTDADDLSAAKFRGVLRQASKPVTVCVAPVGAEGVGGPREVK